MLSMLLTSVKLSDSVSECLCVYFSEHIHFIDSRDSVSECLCIYLSEHNYFTDSRDSVSECLCIYLSEHNYFTDLRDSVSECLCDTNVMCVTGIWDLSSKGSVRLL